MIPKDFARLDICREWKQWADAHGGRSREQMLAFYRYIESSRSELLDFPHSGDKGGWSDSGRRSWSANAVDGLGTRLYAYTTVALSWHPAKESRTWSLNARVTF